MHQPRYEPTTAHLLRLWQDAGLRVPVTAAGLAERDPAAELDVEREFQLRVTGLAHRDIAIPGPAGDITLAVLTEPNPRPGPLVVSFHSGGLVKGTRFNNLREAAGIVRAHGGVLVSPEYRLAPQHPAPAGFDDCYATLAWAFDHADELGGDPTRMIVVGMSGGGNLALATALAARDRGGPRALGVLAGCPMLDDRNDTTSARQFRFDGLWTGADNDVAWDAILGERRGTQDVSPYEAPARARWLDGLPPVFLDVASTEPFRDEVVAFASGIWRDGGDAELHVYPGGTHGHELLSAETWIGRGVLRARAEWVAQLLEPADPQATVDHIVALGRYPIGVPA